MYLKQLRLYNFRKYKNAIFQFSPSINFICGENAAGKTTILEAIYLLISARSFRTQQTIDLLQHNEPSFALEALFVKYDVEQRVKFLFDGKNKKIFINDTLCASAANLLGLIYGVSYTPDDAELVKGGPSNRRHFLDLLIAQSDPLYVRYLSRYQRAMQQRNCLLRSKQLKMIAPWEEEMAKAAEYIVSKRAQVVELLAPVASSVYQTISSEESLFEVQLKSSLYKKEMSIRESFLNSLEKNRRRESELGFTLTGPHKDDLLLTLSQKEARFFGSEGQQRSAVAALRLSSWQKLYETVDQKPLMLVDDMGVSLDSERKKRLMNKLHQMGQVFLTSTESSSFFNLSKDHHTINLK